MVPPDIRPGQNIGNPDGRRSYEGIADRQLAVYLERLDLTIKGMIHWPMRIGYIRNNPEIAQALNIWQSAMSPLLTDVRDRGIMDDISVPRSPYDQRIVACFDKERLRAFGALVFSLSKILPSPTGQPLRIDDRNRQDIPWGKVVEQTQEALGQDPLSRLLLQSPLGREEETIDYGLVTDPDLRNYLEQFEQVMSKEVEMWPMRSEILATNRKLTEFLKLSTSTADLFLRKIFEYKIIKPLRLFSDTSNKRRVQALDKNSARAFAALIWGIGKKVSLSRNDTLWVYNFDTIPLNDVISEVRIALGKHPLTQVIQAGSAEGDSVPAQKTIFSSQQPPVRKPEIDPKVRERELFTKMRKILTEENRAVAASWDEGRIESAILAIPDNFETVSWRLVPFSIGQAVMFIFAFGTRTLQDFDHNLDDITNKKFRNGLDACLKYLRSNEKLGNLANLFDRIMFIVDKRTE